MNADWGRLDESPAASAQMIQWYAPQTFGAVRAAGKPENCFRCNAHNPPWAAPSPLWNLVMRGNDINGMPIFNDMVCVPCFITIAESKGVHGHWCLTVTPMPDDVKTVTPSGRVWNEQTWLWDEPPPPDPGVAENLASPPPDPRRPTNPGLCHGCGQRVVGHPEGRFGICVNRMPWPLKGWLTKGSEVLA